MNEVSESILSIILILVGLYIIIYFLIKHEYYKKFDYRIDLIRLIRISLLVVLSSYTLKTMNNTVINDIFYYLFKIIPAFPFIIYMGFLLDKFIIYKNDENNSKTEIRYLKFAINIGYIILLIVSSYGINYIILTIIWQIAIFSFDYKKEIEIEANIESVDNLECELYESRKTQLTFLDNLIQNYEYDNYAIALNGEWGSGKSEMLNAIVDINKEVNYCIYIRPLISDTFEGLVNVFKELLSQFMKKSGIYSGKNSTLDKYFKEVLKLIQINSKLSLSDIIYLESNTSSYSYRDLKQQLQEDIDLLLINQKKLIVIIDDFDRIDSIKQYEVLSFVKEIIDFKGCVILMAFDYENLKIKDCPSIEYLEKFIGPKVQLVDIEFKEIIMYHSERILKFDTFDNIICRKIAKEIIGNIYNYYHNIETKIDLHKKTLKNKLSEADMSSNDESHENYYDLLKDYNEFYNYSLEKKKYINNSRRVTHFLKEINNTLVLIEKLYNDRSSDLEFLYKNINVSEIIYFFNYIKVFDSIQFNQIVNLKGIEEYKNFLKSNNKIYEEKYFNVISEGIIPTNTFLHRSNETIINTTLSFIKDLFINYYFTKNNMNFITKKEIILKEIDENSFNTSEKLIKQKDFLNFRKNNDLLETLEMYQEVITEAIDNFNFEIRIEKFIYYIIKLYKKEKITNYFILSLLTSRHALINEKSMRVYITVIYRLIDKNTKISKEEKELLDTYIKEVDSNIVRNNKYLFIEILSIVMINDTKDEEIKGLLDKVENSSQLYQNIRDYCLNNNVFLGQDIYGDFKSIIDGLLISIKSKNYEFIPYDIIEKRVNIFFDIYKYVNEISKIGLKITRNYSSLLNEKVDSFDINRIIFEFNELSKEENFNKDMIKYFQQLIRIVVNNNYNLSNICKDDIRKIFNNIYISIPEDYYEWADLDIALNVERILIKNID